MRGVRMGQDQFFVKHRIRERQFQAGFGFQKNGCQHRRSGIDPAEPVLEGSGLPSAVYQVDLCQVLKAARLHQIE